MNKRFSLGSAMPVFSSLLAVVFAFLTGAIYMWVLGKDPISAYSLLVSRGIGSSFGLTETLGSKSFSNI